MEMSLSMEDEVVVNNLCIRVLIESAHKSQEAG